MLTQGVRTIDKVLAMLENSRGDFVSGAEMASGLGISRNAIWKAIKELKVQGYSIESVTNKGYRLSKDNDIISAEGIKSFRVEFYSKLYKPKQILLQYQQLQEMKQKTGTIPPCHLQALKMEHG